MLDDKGLCCIDGLLIRFFDAVGCGMLVLEFFVNLAPVKARLDALAHLLGEHLGLLECAQTTGQDGIRIGIQKPTVLQDVFIMFLADSPGAG